MGIESEKEIFSTKDKNKINSIFSNLVAVKWNDGSHSEYDHEFKTNVNFFRILFLYLSEDKRLLNYLEPNTSYNCYDPKDFSKSYMVIDEKGSSDFLNK